MGVGAIQRRALAEEGLQILALTHPWTLTQGTLAVPLGPRGPAGMFLRPFPLPSPGDLLRGVYATVPPQPFAPCLCNMDFTLRVAGPGTSNTVAFLAGGMVGAT